jgi:hypothetical protein
MPRIWIAILALIFVLSAITPRAHAQSNSYKQANLTSDTAGVAANVDPNLVRILGSGRLTSRRSAKSQGSSAAIMMLPTETEGAL